jgi:putative (di)nucleoside polyphosphate hydrolase
VAFRFTGEESEIEVAGVRGGADPEFSEWRWESIERLPELVVPFKRSVYEHVVRAFRPFAMGG